MNDHGTIIINFVATSKFNVCNVSIYQYILCSTLLNNDQN